MNEIISIIMPVLNMENFLPETLHSLQAQTYTAWELVAVDDGSNDSSLSILNQFAHQHPGKCKILISPKPMAGPAAARNYGIKNAKGEYLIFLDADDLLKEFCLKQRIHLMQNNPSTDWAVFMQYASGFAENEVQNIYSRKLLSKNIAIEFFLKMDPPWQTMAPIWEKKTLLACNGFDENFICMEDPDLHLRALLQNDLKVSIAYNLPPDCIYRTGLKDKTSQHIFYKVSIDARFKFLYKHVIYLEEHADVKNKKLYKRFIRKGYFDFQKSFLLHRLKSFDDEYLHMNSFLKYHKVINYFDTIILAFTRSIFLSNSTLIVALRLRGIMYKIL